MKIKMQTVLAAVSVLALAGCASQREKEKQIFELKKKGGREKIKKGVPPES